MEIRKKHGIIAFVIVVFFAALSLVFTHISMFRSILFSSDFLNQLFFLFLYAVIPCLPAVILRVRFGFHAVKWLVISATAIGVICCGIQIALPDEILYETTLLYETASEIRYAYTNNWIFVFTENVIVSSVPALYCVAFVGIGREIFAALTPSLLFFMSLYVRSVLTSDIVESLTLVFDETVFILMLLSAGFTVWALFLIFISSMIYRKVKKLEKLEKVLIKYTPVILACMLIFALTLGIVTLIINNNTGFTKNYNERFGRYEFTYKNSELYIRKEIFDEYELTDEHIKKFFDGAQTVYKKFAGFFPRYDFPGMISYHAVPEIWTDVSGYAYYGDKIHLNAWADPWDNKTFCEENIFARHLSMIDTGFPSLVCREAGRLFFMSAERPYQYYNAPYVWDAELFAVLAEYYIASEIQVINVGGEIIKDAEREDSDYTQFFGWADKYGYKIISDILKEVNSSFPDIHNEQRHPFALFIKFLSEKTGDILQ